MSQRFSDHSKQLTRALERANDRAWRAVEVALAGRSWWDACKLTLRAVDADTGKGMPGVSFQMLSPTAESGGVVVGDNVGADQKKQEKELAALLAECASEHAKQARYLFFTGELHLLRNEFAEADQQFTAAMKASLTSTDRLKLESRPAMRLAVMNSSISG